MNRDNERLLVALVEKGRVSIRSWMLKHSISETILKEFDADIYKAGFAHIDTTITA